MTNTVAAVSLAIPQRAQEQLIALADAQEEVWRGTSKIIVALIKDSESDAMAEGVVVQKMKLYQDVAALVGVKSVTVRGWLRVYKRVGDDLLDQYPFRFAHWRTLLKLVTGKTVDEKRRNLEELAEQYAATSDDYGGKIIPPDVLSEKANGAVKEKDPFGSGVRAAVIGLTKALRHKDGKAPKRVRDSQAALALIEWMAE